MSMSAREKKEFMDLQEAFNELRAQFETLVDRIVDKVTVAADPVDGENLPSDDTEAKPVRTKRQAKGKGTK